MFPADVTTLETGGRTRDYGPPRLIVELTNICNLHCSYCLRDEDALYNQRASFFPVDLLRRVIREARDAIGASHVMFTGGETTLHPQFQEIIETVGAEGLKCSFVTNGWHFERIWPVINENRNVITHVAFSMDGPTRETHDRWRGDGSYVRLVRAFSRCRRAELPFVVKCVIRKDTLPQFEQIAMFVARMGAAALSFGHLLPTSDQFHEELGLIPQDRTLAEQEIALLARVFKMRISLDVGYYNIDPAPPCSALAGRSCNIDYRGNLSLCCNLSGFRGAAGVTEVVADLNGEDFASAYGRLNRLAQAQMITRQQVLDDYAAKSVTPDLYTGSPCLLCLQSFGKIPWHDAPADLSRKHSLPILNR
ncbi:MAG TPA: radical SAM protein [Pyrinomonadaceae bacterium]|nr:radical SAM protein [Pyrinomonadaceae bacterium]